MPRKPSTYSVCSKPCARGSYVSADQPSFRSLDLITLQGHESVRLLALLALPIFAINGRGIRGEPPHLLWRVAGTASFAVFIQISMTIFERLQGVADLAWAQVCGARNAE